MEDDFFFFLEWLHGFIKSVPYATKLQCIALEDYKID